MADRYWVGGDGNWSDTAHWSTTSGGAGGASVPTASDNAIFDSLSSAVGYTVTFNTTIDCLDLTLGAPAIVTPRMPLGQFTGANHDMTDPVWRELSHEVMHCFGYDHQSY